ncbi:hypothetical protein TNCV_260381 [Trichonephila clavipes]|nr:hypothetical protein TNCV_260381 [Trichonephila clavipes]
MPSTSLPLSPTSRDDMRLDGYLESPSVTKALHIYKLPCLFLDSNLGFTAQQSYLNIVWELVCKLVKWQPRCGHRHLTNRSTLYLQHISRFSRM